MWWFRKSFLKRIYKQIKQEKAEFCCLVESWHKMFICWSELKEVEENFNSKYLYEYIRGNKEKMNCGNAWFFTKGNRLGFLNECITRSYKTK